MNITVPIKIVINDNLCGFADPHVQDYRSMPLNRVTLKTKKNIRGNMFAESRVRKSESSKR